MTRYSLVTQLRSHEDTVRASRIFHVWELPEGQNKKRGRNDMKRLLRRLLILIALVGCIGLAYGPSARAKPCCSWCDALCERCETDPSYCATCASCSANCNTLCRE